jgi:hypothetical protein
MGTDTEIDQQFAGDAAAGQLTAAQTEEWLAVGEKLNASDTWKRSQALVIEIFDTVTKVATLYGPYNKSDLSWIKETLLPQIQAEQDKLFREGGAMQCTLRTLRGPWTSDL